MRATRERPILFSGPMVRAILDGRKTQTRRVMVPQPEWADREGGYWLWDRKQAKRHVITELANFPPPYGFTQSHWQWLSPFGVVGDRLWVRETTGRGDARFAKAGAALNAEGRPLVYRADGDWCAEGEAWRPSIFMPRAASRITLEITNVRVERIQSISEDDAAAEGFSAVAEEPWWQGYRDWDGDLIHQQYRGAEPPEWMVEPKRMTIAINYDPLATTAAKEFRITWNDLNAKRGYGWEVNPWVWVIEFRAHPTETTR